MNNDNKNNEEENKYKRYIELYKSNKDFKKGVNAAIYILVVIIFSVVLITTVNTGGKKSNNKTTTTQATVIKYQDMLDNLLDNKESSINIKINDNSYKIVSKYGNSILTGTLESKEGTYKFKIKDQTIYEIRLEEEIPNESLFKDIDTNIICNDLLVHQLKNNSGIKVEENDNTIYKYEDVNINDILYNINVIINNNTIKHIEFTSNNISYVINYV